MRYPMNQRPDFKNIVLPTSPQTEGEKQKRWSSSLCRNDWQRFVLASAGIDGAKKCHQLKKEERTAIVRTLKNWKIGRVKEIPLERGEVTAGGVDLREVNAKNMKSRVVKGLYICGEALDVAGPIGGYNLQAAFSTGYVAGEAAAADWKSGSSIEDMILMLLDVKLLAGMFLRASNHRSQAFLDIVIRRRPR